MLSTYYGITYEDYSNLYRYVITCSIFIIVPLFYLIFIREYFSIGIYFLCLSLWFSDFLAR